MTEDRDEDLGPLTWDYRIVASSEWSTVPGSDPVEVFEVREVYYYADDTISMWSEAVTPYGESEDDLRADLEMMLAAFERPTLEMADLPGAVSKRRTRVVNSDDDLSTDL